MNRSEIFFETAYQNFLTAISGINVINQFYRLAGFTFCLKFAGRAMIDVITPALKHLEIDAQNKCDLTICLWDSVSTCVQPMHLSTDNNAYAIRGEIIEYDHDPIHAVLDIHTKALNIFNKNKNIALYYIGDTKKLPWWVKGSPLQLILHWWMRTKEHQLVHAAVVGHSSGGILLTGKSGSGKSTTSLVCMKAGMKYVSEDYCLVSDLPKISAHSVYNSAKFEEKTLRWFPEIQKYIDNSDRTVDQKAFIYHHQFQPEKILKNCPVKAILTLKIVKAQNSWLEPIDSYNALTALSVSTMWQLTHTGLAVLNHLKRLVSALPCYQLHLGNDLKQIPKLIETLL